jgi:hypothetical protein
MEGTLALLQPFQEFTKLISSSESVISEVLPAIRTISRYLSKPNLQTGVGRMKRVLLENLMKRFDYVEKDNNFTYATFLDPRFKMAFLKESVREITRAGIIEEAVSKAILNIQDLPGQESSDVSVGPTPKRRRDDTHTSLWDCFSEVLSATGSEDSTETTTGDEQTTLHVKTTDEVEAYLAGNTKLYKKCVFYLYGWDNCH